MVDAAGKFLLILSLTAIACSTPPEIRALKDAKMYRRHAQYTNAIQAYQLVLSVDTANTEALAGMGLCQIELENLDEARAAYEKLGILHPDNEEAFFRLGQIDLAQGKF
ncbi:MAG: tetratricopeptide repeat protein, partial [Candidatus Glassbacteria bacterium]